MNLVKTEGIVLGQTNYSESSKILKVLTKDYGMISIMSKGCRNIKSKLRGVSSIFTYGDFHLYYKEQGISTLVGVDIKNTFLNLQKDISKISYASYLLDLTEQVLKHTENELVYQFLISTLEKINEGYDVQALTNILELKYLDFLGIRPILDCCSICGNQTEIVTISAETGGYICKNCYHGERVYSDRTIKLIRMFYYVDISKITKLEIKEESLKELNEFINDYYDRYSGLYLKSKSFLENISKIG
ncbi:MAG: DNA repair protein RecO [Bacilli bacterium]|nr:DNA repair protein RecO [Bacilli bacterium]